MDYYHVGEYEISKICLQSIPCIHFVRKIGKDGGEQMTGTEIYKLLEKNGLSHEHFNCYKNIITFDSKKN